MDEEQCYFCGDPQWEWPRHCAKCGSPCCSCCQDINGLCPDCAPDPEGDWDEDAQAENEETK